jgi:hypothetical protein
MTTPREEQQVPVVDLDRIELKAGAHASRDDGVCAMEAVAWIAGESHTDHPSCVSPVLGAFLRQWNDDLDDEGRQRLKPYLARTIGTAGDGQDEARGWLCADWLVRVHAPVWLELAGVRDAAAALRGLPELRDPATLGSARPAIDAARSRADAARDAAWAAAGDAARAAAWAAAGAAAGEAAWAAARAAAWAAAWAAAGDALRPTTLSLQASALELLERTIDPSARTKVGAA